jgi:hypothetical protein
MAYLIVRGDRPWMATAALIGRPSPAAKSIEAVAYKGNLERAAQIASVASSHDPARNEMRAGRRRHVAAITKPGINKSAAWAAGTVQGKSLPIWRIHPSTHHSFLKSMRNRSR